MRRLVGAALIGLVATAGAQPVLDPQWAAGLAARRFVDVERAASARIATHPDDIDAHAALIRAALMLNDPARRDAALKLLEACVARAPRSAVCHYGVGSVQGAQVMSQGMLKAALNAGRIRDALQKAVELDPSLYAARSGLVQFYLLAPGLAGGSAAKAMAVAQAGAALQPEHAKALLALIALDQGRLDDAERQLTAVKPSSDRELLDDVDGLWTRLAFEYLGLRKGPNARPIFERFIKERPDRAVGHYGLGRVLSDAGSWEPAITEFTLAANLDGAADLPIDYRLAIALQSTDRRDAARAALSRFIAAGKGSQKNRDDAERRLAELR